MKVFTDSTETSFFKTDYHLKNLHEIEINSIEDFIYRYSLRSKILLGMECWMVGRFDELLSGNPVVDASEEPALHGEWLEIDFVSDIPYIDILLEISKFENISYSMEDYKNSGIFQSMSHEWINDDNDEKWIIVARNDDRKLEVVIDPEGNTTARIIDNEL